MSGRVAHRPLGRGPAAADRKAQAIRLAADRWKSAGASGWMAWVCVAGLVLTTGCRREEQIASYRAPKPDRVYAANHVPRPAAQDGSAPSGGPASQAAGPGISYDMPEGWSAGRLEVARGGITFRYRAAFDVVDGDRRLEVTVSDFPVAAADALDNVNRWRGQVGLGPITQEQLQREQQLLAVGGEEGQYVEMTGPPGVPVRQSILAVMVPHGGSVWFFKLMGDAELAAREKQRFQAFVQSVKFDS